MRKLAIIDKNPNAKYSQWRAAKDPKKFFHRDNSLISDIKKYDPDIIFINKGASFTQILPAIKGYKSIYFYGDWYQPIAQYVKQLAVVCDAVLLTNRDEALRYELKKMGQKKIYFISQGTDIEIFHPVETLKKYEIVFPGNYLGPTFLGSDLRMNLVRHLLKSGYDLKVVGDAWPEDIDSLPRQGMRDLNITLNKAIISVGINHFIDVPYYTSNRLYQCMATGTPHITWHSPGVASLFKFGYTEVNSFEELNAKIDELLDNDFKRKMIGVNQCMEIQQRHTIFHFWQKIENILETIYD